MAINTPCAAYMKMEDSRKLTNALWGDTPAMRMAMTDYLPAMEGEYYEYGGQEGGRYGYGGGYGSGGSESYDQGYRRLNYHYYHRLNETTLKNYFVPAIKGLSGKVFQKPIVLGDELSPMMEWWENVDLSGCNINDFGLKIFESSLRHGVSYILVDAPTDSGAMTLADQQSMNLRPYCVHIPADQVIGWKVERINNNDMLIDVRIEETLIMEDDDYVQEEYTQIRQISKNFSEDGMMQSGCTWRIWQEDSDNEWQIVEEGQYTLDYIPLFPYYTNRTGFFEAETYFTTLAHLNVEHWQSSSYQRNILNTARVPRFGIYGITDEEVDQLSKHGVGNGIVSSMPAQDVRAEWIECDGGSIEHGERDLNMLEDQMAIRSLDPILKKAPNTEIATIANIEASKSHSMLQNWSEALQRSLKCAVMAMYELYGQPMEDCEIKVNDDYQIVPNLVERAGELRDQRALGEISRQHYLEELRRVGFYDDDFDVELEIERIEMEEGMGMGGMDNEMPMNEPMADDMPDNMQMNMQDEM